MNYNYNENYQYDSCISQGICSVNPRTSSLQEVLVLYLQLTAFYALKLCEIGKDDKSARNIIMNTISIMVSNFEFSEKDFKSLVGGFQKVLPKLIQDFKSITDKTEDVPENLKVILNLDKNTNIITFLQIGEKEFLKTIQKIPATIIDLYRILFVLAKSICANVLDLESFDVNADKGYLTILHLLNSITSNSYNEKELKELIFEVAMVDSNLMKLLQETQEKRYGKRIRTEVSYTTKPGKAILVVGSNIRELEDVLEAVKGKDIDIYTHDEMILANTFPKFKEYSNLKGQYGQGVENCLLDFATFPGPIILTRHSLYNVEHLYRGLLYTTDFASSKGVIPIINKDFSDVIKSAECAKGFKTGKECESITIGVEYQKILTDVEKNINKFSRLFVIGLGAYTLEQKVYFEKLFAQVPEDILVLSLSFCIQRENIKCLNACFDTYSITQIVQSLNDKVSVPIDVFFPKCDRHTISQMIYLIKNTKANVYIGKCTPIMLNPNMMITLQKVFGIQTLSSVKKDLDNILKN